MIHDNIKDQICDNNKRDEVASMQLYLPQVMTMTTMMSTRLRARLENLTVTKKCTLKTMHRFQHLPELLFPIDLRKQ